MGGARWGWAGFSLFILPFLVHKQRFQPQHAQKTRYISIQFNATHNKTGKFSSGSQICRGHFSGYAGTSFSIKIISLKFIYIIIFYESFEHQNHTFLALKRNFSINFQPNYILFANLKSLFYLHSIKHIKANFYRALFKIIFYVSRQIRSMDSAESK